MPPERDLLLVARRMLVVEVEAGLTDRDAPLGRRRAVRASSHSASSFDASCGWRPTVAYTSDAAPRSRAPGCDVSKSVPTHTIHSTPAARPARPARRRLPRKARSGPAPAARWQSESTQRSRLRDPPRASGTATRPSPASNPRATGPTPPRRARAASSGRPGSPSRRHSSAAATGSPATEQRDDAQRLEAVAEHRRHRGRVARLVDTPTAARSSMNELAARIRSQTAPKPPRSRGGHPSRTRRTRPRPRRSGPSARASGTTPPQ